MRKFYTALQSRLAGESRTAHADQFEERIDSFIWFFGPSATGKKTLIRALTEFAAPRDDPLGRALGLRQFEFLVPVILRVGLTGKPASEWTACIQQRTDTYKRIYRANIGAKWLIHGQYIDYTRGVLEALRGENGKLPSSRAVYLFLHEATFAQRRRQDIQYAQAYASKDETLEKLHTFFDEVIVHRE